MHLADGARGPTRHITPLSIWTRLSVIDDSLDDFWGCFLSGIMNSLIISMCILFQPNMLFTLLWLYDSNVR